jgi:peptidoglycan LD-endopeptidase CwlK
MSYKLSNRSIERLKGIDKVLIDIVTEGIKNSPIDFGIPNDGGLRTTQRQAEMYAQGRTVAGKKITNADGVNKKSYHQSGKAFDIYAFVDGKASWEHKYYEPIARHLQKVAKEKFGIVLEWGGDFRTFSDMPHFQIT